MGLVNMRIGDLRTKQPQKPASPSSLIITVIGPKGGVGKTLLAVSIAVIASLDAGKKTLLIDADLDSGDLGVHLDLPEGKSISDLAPYCADPRPETIAEFVTVHERSGVDVVMAPPRPELAEFIRSEQIGNLVESARRFYQYVVIDTPASLDCDIVYECLEHSDLQVLVVTQDLTSVKQAKTSIELMQRLGHNTSERCHLVINKYYERALLGKARILEFLDFRYAHTINEERETIDRTILDGVPAVVSANANEVSAQLRAFARGLLALPEDRPRKHRTGVNWFWKGRQR